MPKKIYMSRAQIAAYVATQAGIHYSHHKNAYFRQCDEAVYEQSLRLIDDFLNNRVETEAGAVKEIEELIYTVKHRANAKLSLQMQKALHRLQSQKAAHDEMQKRFEKLGELTFISSVLNNKKQAAVLSPAELNIIKETLDKQPDNAIIRRLREKAQSYALLCYSKLKNKQELNLRNPEHRKLVNSYNLEHIRTFSNTPKTQKRPEVQIKQPQQKKKAFAAFGILSEKFKLLKNNTQQKLKNFGILSREKIRKTKKIAVLAAIAAVSVFVGKGLLKETGRANMSSVKVAKEIKTAPAEQTTAASTQTADFAKFAQTTVTGDYYDTALQIHLKSKENVQKLYNQVAQLAEDGKISPSEKNSIKQYAHAFTMYRLIRPNSKENKAIQNLLNGGKEDKGYIENLVKKAGKYGNGVKPDNNNIKHSNFDKASPALQQQHLKNLLTR